MNNQRLLVPLSGAALLLSLMISCSKSDSGGGNPDPCADITISVAAEAAASAACRNDGKITVTASGSAGLTYSIDGRNFQASNVFSNLAPGSYTVTVKNGAGCSKSQANINITESGTTPGATFTEVKKLVQTICTGCHAPGGQQPNPNFTVDCNIVNNAAKINERAVVQGTMPPTGPLSQAQKDVITAWVNAGGKISD